MPSFGRGRPHDSRLRRPARAVVGKDALTQHKHAASVNGTTTVHEGGGRNDSHSIKLALEWFHIWSGHSWLLPPPRTRVMAPSSSRGYDGDALRITRC